MGDEREEFYEVFRCDNCGVHAEHENWRCGKGMCVDGNPEPSFTLVEVVPKAQRDKAIAERGALESAIKQHKQATESRLRLLAGAARQPEKSDLMLKPDADLYAALDSVHSEIQEGRDG